MWFHKNDLWGSKDIDFITKWQGILSKCLFYAVENTINWS